MSWNFVINAALVVLILVIAARGYRFSRRDGLSIRGNPPTPERALRNAWIMGAVAVAGGGYAVWQNNENAWFTVFCLAVLLGMAVLNWWLVSHRHNHA